MNQPWSLPVVAETYDGWLNDINGFHVQPDHVSEALGAASSGPVAEGAVGGGTGMICYGFKGGHRHFLARIRSRGINLHRRRSRAGQLRRPPPFAHRRRSRGARARRSGARCGRTGCSTGASTRRFQSDERRWLDHHRRRHRRTVAVAPTQALGAPCQPRHRPHRGCFRQRLRRYLSSPSRPPTRAPPEPLQPASRCSATAA